MANVCHLDIETFSEEDLKSAGVYRYAEHPSTEFYVLGYRFDAEKRVTLWMPFTPMPALNAIGAEVLKRCQEKYKGKYEVHLIISAPMPRDLYEHIIKGRDALGNGPGGELRAHNAQFERVVLSGTAGKRVNFPKLTIAQFVCTAAKMAAHGLPRALGDAAEALGTHPKDETGRISMLQLAKPRKPTKADPATRWTFENAPEKYIEVLTYNVDDVLAECGVDDAVPDLTPYEQKVYELDQLINQRGIRVDLVAIDNVRALIAEYKSFLEGAMEKATLDVLLDEPGLKPTQRDKIAAWIRDHGFPGLFDMQADTVKWLLLRTDVPDHVKHVLRIYSTYGAKAVTKFETIVESVCRDGRVRGMFLFDGANTGRWSSLIIQLQNLFRPVIDDPDTAISAFSSRSLQWIKALYSEDPMKVFASTVRGMLIAAAEHDLSFSDYAGIESRGVAWLFDEDWKLEVFKKYDIILRDEQTGEILRNKKGEPLRAGPDNYVTAYAEMFQVSVEEVTKFLRQIGKVVELFMAYEGGCGAFVTGAETYNINLEELAQIALPMIPEEIKAQAQKMWDEMPQHRAGLPWHQFIAFDSLKRMWRNKHPKIKQGWRDIKAAAEQAVQFDHDITKLAAKYDPSHEEITALKAMRMHHGAYAIPNGKIAFKVVEYKGRKWLQMRLPSGRRISYFKPRWIPEESVIRKDEWGNEYTEIIPGEMRYWGTDTHTRRWMEVSTYGGRLTENAVQGLSACLLRDGMFAKEEAGYPLIGTVHDEIIAEPKKGFGSLDEANKLMCRGTPWSKGLPLAAEGHRCGRYRK